MKIKHTTLLYILKDNQILLAEKKRGFGAGKINGVGGKIEPCETIEQCMIREAQEEIGITPINATHVATITFKFDGTNANELEITSVFIAKEYEGKIIETEEMRPAWYNLNQIPFEQMFSADRIWMPEILKGNKITAEVIFDSEFNTITTNISPMN